MDKSTLAGSRSVVEKFRADVTKKLHEDNAIARIAAQVEKITGVDRLFIVLGAVVIFGFYLIVGYFAQLLCNVAGFAYPAYASFLAIETTDSKDDTQWLTYWVVFGVFSVMEFASEFILSWFPIYYLCKFLFLLYLYLPMTAGADKLYRLAVHPMLQKVKEIKTASM